MNRAALKRLPVDVLVGIIEAQARDAKLYDGDMRFLVNDRNAALQRAEHAEDKIANLEEVAERATADARYESKLLESKLLESKLLESKLLESKLLEYKRVAAMIDACWHTLDNTAINDDFRRAVIDLKVALSTVTPFL